MSRPKLGKVVFYRRVLPAWIPILDAQIESLSKSGEPFKVIFPDKSEATIPRQYCVSDFGPSNITPSFLDSKLEQLAKQPNSLASHRLGKFPILKPSQKK